MRKTRPLHTARTVIEVLNVRDLQYLTVLADELSFSRAAARLNISQPTLTQTVQRLERLVGGRLLERTTRRSRLTPAGVVLVEGARQLLLDLVRLEEVTRDTAAGRTAERRVGSVNPALRLLVPRILRVLHAELPDLRISLHPASSHAQLRQLADGHLEAGILRSRSAPPGFAVEPLMREPLYVALPAGHPLATESRVELAMLDGCDVVMASRNRNPAFFDELMRSFSAAACAPGRVVETDDLMALLALVAAGTGVSVLPLLFVDRDHPDITFRPLGRDFGLPLVLVYAVNQPSAAVSALAAAARTEAARFLEQERRRHDHA